MRVVSQLPWRWIAVFLLNGNGKALRRPLALSDPHYPEDLRGTLPGLTNKGSGKVSLLGHNAEGGTSGVLTAGILSSSRIHSISCLESPHLWFLGRRRRESRGLHSKHQRKGLGSAAGVTRPTDGPGAAVSRASFSPDTFAPLQTVWWRRTRWSARLRWVTVLVAQSPNSFSPSAQWTHYGPGCEMSARSCSPGPRGGPGRRLSRELCGFWGHSKCSAEWTGLFRIWNSHADLGVTIEAKITGRQEELQGLIRALAGLWDPSESWGCAGSCWNLSSTLDAMGPVPGWVQRGDGAGR